MPLFFLCVNTNVGYKVVAEFMCWHGDEMSMLWALGILQQWNPQWWIFQRPKLGQLKHSSQVWWCTSAISITSRQFNVGQRLGKMASIRINSNLYSLPRQKLLTYQPKRNTRMLYQKNVRTYVEKTWIPCAFQWCYAFRTSQLLNIVNTNNGVSL